MPAEDEFRERAEGLLRAAANAGDLRERGRLIDEALRWHALAFAAHAARVGAPDGPPPPMRARH